MWLIATNRIYATIGLYNRHGIGRGLRAFISTLEAAAIVATETSGSQRTGGKQGDRGVVAALWKLGVV